MPISLLVVWLVAIVVVVALGGLRRLVVEYPHLVASVKRFLIVPRAVPVRRRVRRVDSGRYIMCGRLTIKHRSRFKRAYQSRHTTSIIPIPVPQTRDITSDGVKELTEAQKTAARKLFTRGASANELAALLGGDRNKRLKQLAAVKADPEREQEQEPLAQLAPQPGIVVPAMEPIPV